jgi:serine/threonine-protein kinase
LQVGIGPGTQVGGYVIEEMLGRGGMGVVYLAYHPRLQRRAAIKVLPGLQVGREDARLRFEREAQSVARLRHPNILSVFDFGEVMGQPYMITEYMPNGSLDEQLPEGPLEIGKAVAILGPVAEALDYAHGQGLVHRDVKPANIFMDADMKPVLADFGLAKLYDQESLTISGSVTGTPLYISPEQAHGRPLTAAADQYSLAVMAHRLLTGKLPFVGETAMDVLFAHVHKTPPKASSLNPALNSAVDAVLLKGLAKDPQQRWPSCRDLVAGIEAAGQGKLNAATVTIEVPREAAAEPASPGRRRPRWLLPVGVLMVLALGASALYISRSAWLPSVAGVPTPAPPAEESPSATPGPPRVMTVVPPSPLKRGSVVTIHVKGWDVRTHPLAYVGVAQGNVVYAMSSQPVQVSADGTFEFSGPVPADSNLRAGSALLVACPSQKTAIPQCLSLQVSLAA